MEEQTMVPAITDGVATEATPAQGVEQTQTPVTTPSTQPVDAEVLRQQYEQQIRQKEIDLNRMKSSFQRKESQLERQMEERRVAFEQELERAKISNMDEDQRKIYESTAGIRKAQQLESQLQQLQLEKNEAVQRFEAYTYFQSKGVPANEIITDGSYEDLWNSGMEYITSVFEQVQKKASTPPPPVSAPAATPPVAPPVVTATATQPFTGTTWDALIKEWGSEESVWRAVETGQLDPSVLPRPRV